MDPGAGTLGAATNSVTVNGSTAVLDLGGTTQTQVAINAFSGIPSMGELGLLKWRPGGGNIWFLPGTPMQDIIDFIAANVRPRLEHV